MKKYLITLFLLAGCGSQTEEESLEDKLNNEIRNFALACSKQECAQSTPAPSIAKLLDPSEAEFGSICWTWTENKEEKLGVAISQSLLKNKDIKTVVYQKTFDCLSWLGRNSMSLSDFESSSNLILD